MAIMLIGLTYSLIIHRVAVIIVLFHLLKPQSQNSFLVPHSKVIRTKKPSYIVALESNSSNPSSHRESNRLLICR